MNTGIRPTYILLAIARHQYNLWTCRSQEVKLTQVPESGPPHFSTQDPLFSRPLSASLRSRRKMPGVAGVAIATETMAERIAPSRVTGRIVKSCSLIEDLDDFGSEATSYLKANGWTDRMELMGDGRIGEALILPVASLYVISDNCIQLNRQVVHISSHIKTVGAS